MSVRHPVLSIYIMSFGAKNTDFSSKEHAPPVSYPLAAMFLCDPANPDGGLN